LAGTFEVFQDGAVQAVMIRSQARVRFSSEEARQTRMSGALEAAGARQSVTLAPGVRLPIKLAQEEKA